MKVSCLGMVVGCRNYVDKKGNTRYFCNFISDSGEIFSIESSEPLQNETSYSVHDINVTCGKTREGNQWTKLTFLN